MAGIISKARNLRLEYQVKVGKIVTMEEVAEQVGITRAALNRIELNKTERIDFDTLTKLCVFYSERLGRRIGVGDILEFDPEKVQVPGLVGAALASA